MDRIRAALRLSCLSLVLVGCAVNDPPEEDPGTGAGRWTGAQSGETHIDPEWWNQFGSEQLHTLILGARANSFELKNLVLRVRIAEESLTKSRRDLLPKLSATVSGQSGRSGTSGGSSSNENVQIGSQFAWEIDLWGRLRQLSASQLEGLEGSEHQWRTGYLQLVDGLARAYVRLRQFDEQQALHRSSIARNEEILGIYKARQKHGRTTLEQVRTQEAEVLRLEGELEELRRQRQIEANAISSLLGEDPEAFDLSPSPLREELKIFAMPEEIQVNVLERRPDILAANANVRSAYHLLESAKAARLPAFGIGGSGSLVKVPSSPAQWAASITPNITFPFLDPATLSAENIRESELEIARNDYKQTVREALNELADAMVNLQSRLNQLERAGEQLRLLKEAHSLLEIRFREDRSSRLEVLESERSLLGAQQSELNLYALTLQDLIGLHTALGGGWRTVDVSDESLDAPRK